MVNQKGYLVDLIEKCKYKDYLHQNNSELNMDVSQLEYQKSNKSFNRNLEIKAQELKESGLDIEPLLDDNFDLSENSISSSFFEQKPILDLFHQTMTNALKLQ